MTRQISVLTIEDNEDDAELILRELHRSGFDVKSKRVTTAEAMLESLNGEAWDVILADYRLPSFNAPAALALLQETRLDIPFIVVSGTIGEETAVDMMRAGAHDYLLKSNLKRLGPAIEREMREAEYRRERGQSRKALRASEDRYRTVFENTGTATVILEQDTTISTANAGFTQLCGYSKDEVEGKMSWTQFVVEEDLQRMRGFHNKRREDVADAPTEYEFRFVDRKGNIKNVFLRVDIIPGTKKSVASLLDITERKRAEEALRESERRYRSVFEETAAATIIVDREMRFVMVNERFEQLSGYSKEELEQKITWERFVAPSDLERLREYHKARREDGGEAPREYEFTFIDKQGRAKEVLTCVGVIPGTESSVVSMLDITGRKRAEEALRSSESRFRELAELFPETVFETDVDGLLTFANRRLSEEFGYADGDITKGISCFDLIAPEDRERVRQSFADRLKGNPWGLGEYTGLRRDGSTFPILLHSAPICPSGESVGLRGLIVDMSELSQLRRERAHLEEQYHQAMKMEAVGQLAGGVAHDLNNILTPIIAHAEMLLDGVVPENERKQSVEQVFKAGQRARDLVGQLLSFGRRQALSVKPVDVNSIVSNFEVFLRRTIREDIAIKLVLASSIPAISADAGQLEQIIMNLAINAQDAMPGGGRLIIETSSEELDQRYANEHHGVAPGKYVMLAISDTGEGMDAETRKRVFEPFFTTKAKGKGTGLGLATVYGLVKQHNGAIWLYSEPGRGTVFKLYFPAIEEAPVHASSPKAAVKNMRGAETVVVAEDYDMVRNLVVGLLKRHGYTVFSVPAGGECLELIDNHVTEIDLLLTDVVLPDMNGKALFQKAKERFPDIKVLYMSGYTNNGVADCVQFDEEMPLIQKPFTPKNLLLRLRSVLDES